MNIYKFLKVEGSTSNFQICVILIYSPSTIYLTFSFYVYLSVFRYFECRPQFGIFAKVSKVTKAASGPGSTLTTPRRTSTGGLGSRYGTGLTSLTRERSGSQDSISSVGSSVSTSSRSRVRLGVTSLNDSKKVHAAR